MFHVPCRDHRVRNLPLFQKQAIILLSGVPATGKSEFARHLARECGFAHYDLECHPRGWPHPELKATWDASRSGFVAQLRQYHERIVLDWGFPPSAVPWVEELRRSGAKLVWFDGDIARAQQVFVQRGGIALERFDRQIKAINEAGYPASLQCIVVPALSPTGAFLAQREIERMIFK